MTGKAIILDTTNDRVVIENNCPICGAVHTVTLAYSRYRYMIKRNMNIQDAFPELSPAEREQLISGLCLKCQEYVFGGDEF
jgi:hypothetical protein